MLYTIENDALRVRISDLGAELQSLQTADGHEYLWQGDPAIWSGRAPNLFPICGRLTQGKYTWQGNTYEMTLHGFAKLSVLTAAQQEKDRISFRLESSPETMAIYPFPFVLTVTYALSGSTLTQTFTVENTGTGVLPFAVGGHPGFNVPLEEGEAFEDCYVEFDTIEPAKKVVMSETCFDTRRRDPFPLEEGRILRLRHDLFDHDAIFLTDMSKGVTLKSAKSSRSVHLSYPDMNAVGFWHKPHTTAPYVCIEPWYSLPADDGIVDDLATKQLMIRLEPGRTYENSFTITVK